jgi:hypothetical protein
MPTAVEQMRRSKWPSLYSRCSLPALLLCAACSASHPGTGTVREGELPRAREGYVPGAGGVRLSTGWMGAARTRSWCSTADPVSTWRGSGSTSAPSPARHYLGPVLVGSAALLENVLKLKLGESPKVCSVWRRNISSWLKLSSPRRGRELAYIIQARKRFG